MFSENSASATEHSRAADEANPAPIGTVESTMRSAPKSAASSSSVTATGCADSPRATRFIPQATPATYPNQPGMVPGAMSLMRADRGRSSATDSSASCMDCALSTPSSRGAAAVNVTY